MTVLHIATFRWKDAVTEVQVPRFHQALIELRGMLPILLTYRHGTNLGLRDGNYDYGVVAEVASPEDVSRYLDHPLHQEFAKEFVVPMVAERAAVQIAIPDA